MKFITCLLLISAVMSAVFAYPQFNTTPSPYIPQITGNGGGSNKQGYDINLDVRQRVYQSPNQRHAVDATGGYSQHLGGPYGNSPASHRVGATYTYTFG